MFTELMQHTCTQQLSTPTFNELAIGVVSVSAAPVRHNACSVVSAVYLYVQLIQLSRARISSEFAASLTLLA